MYAFAYQLVHHRVIIHIMESVRQVFVTFGNHCAIGKGSGKILPGALVVCRYENKCNTLSAGITLPVHLAQCREEEVNALIPVLIPPAGGDQEGIIRQVTANQSLCH